MITSGSGWAALRDFEDFFAAFLVVFFFFAFSTPR
jgi:hypothetical protein